MPLPRGKFPMPLRKRRYPVGKFDHRRTIEFLSRGKLHLKDSVKVITISYKTGDPLSAGLREFLKEKIPQIQYKNPSVQILPLKNQGKFPCINVYHNNDHKTLIDCDAKGSNEIFQELCELAGKSESEVSGEKARALSVVNPANFGDLRRGRFCICEIPGQVPCPAVKPLTNVKHEWKDRNSQES